jgi:hypothetical protein
MSVPDARGEVVLLSKVHVPYTVATLCSLHQDLQRVARCRLT